MWIILSFLYSLSVSGQTIVSKKIILNQSKLMGMWSWVFFASIIAGVYTLFSGFVITDSSFWNLLIIRIILDTVGIWTVYTALSKAEVSTVVALQALFPIFTLGTAFFFNNQVPAASAVLGTFMIGGAAYLTIRADQKNIKVNNKDLNTAMVLMLVTVIQWSIVENVHFKAIQVSNPATYFFLSYLGFATIYTVWVFVKEKEHFLNTFTNKRLFFGNFSNGALGGIARIFALNALRTGLIGYVAAIKTTNILITTFLSGIFLKEKLGTQKIFAAVVATVGVILIVTSS